MNGLVARAQKVPDEGWKMQDGTPWPGNNAKDHPGMIQVLCIYIIFCDQIFENNQVCELSAGIPRPEW